MATIAVLHHVADYLRWREVYDKSEPVRKAGGVIKESVYQAKGELEQCPCATYLLDDGPGGDLPCQSRVEDGHAAGRRPG